MVRILKINAFVKLFHRIVVLPHNTALAVFTIGHKQCIMGSFDFSARLSIYLISPKTVVISAMAFSGKCHHYCYIYYLRGSIQLATRHVKVHAHEYAIDISMLMPTVL